MTTDDATDRAHLEELRRIAYGRTNSVEDEERATAARRELEDLERVGHLGPAPVDEPPTAEAHPHDLEKEHAIARSRGWVVPALTALVIGAFLGGAVATLAGGPSAATPAPTPTFTPGSSARPAGGTPLTTGSSFISGPGSLEAAEEWFSRAQSVDDLNELFFGDPTRYVPDSIRLVQSTDSSEVWVAKTPEGGRCLMVTSRNEGAGTCVTGEEFTRGGLTLGHQNVRVAWDGVRLAVAYSAP